MKEKWRIVGNFFGHLAMGAAMFTGLLVFGTVLRLALGLVSSIVNDGHFIAVMYYVESVILYADVMFLIWWSLYSMYKAIKELMK